ncbi:CoA transferase [Acinetobacter baumannii]|uniref:L-carnitine dehydrogenase n=1 Tax=Acinetobacter baumannii TaxID=470 RepID=A0A333B3K7_ACIBA|nr:MULTISPECIES: CoA transferase [Acinetobacter calcoaceticus/baumannii complex]EXA59632.1 coA-transferase III family protein [Acinetobacter baumannii 1035119]EXI36707.1 coA-transferase III family protein [Acinetobacter baumannii 846928]MBN6534194.1 CoA transferase [Acinetobacter pittii]MCT9260251.1 CoA transferase [Acinetobacter baumannii]MDC4327715.1 CoA transferase [Acinetobacter baumannii]
MDALHQPSGPLLGVKVIDLSSVVMGPYTSQILGDMGADVLKVESVDGDVFRYTAPSKHPTMSASFIQLNRNKQSISLNLKKLEEKASLLKLISSADVLLYNIRPRSMSKLGLDYTSLQKINPRLIYCGVYGFSENGPYSGKPAYDDLIQALSGLADLQGRNKIEYKPEYLNTVIADKVTGITAAYAIAMALFEREKSGLGQAIDVPMFETMVSFNLMEHMAEATFTDNPKPNMGYGRVLSKSRKPHQTKDGYLSILPYTSAQWERFFILSGLEHYAKEERFINPALRGQNIDEMYSILSKKIKEKTTEEWMTLLKDADIPMAKVNTVESLLDDEHLKHIGFFKVYQHPTEGNIRLTDIPTKFSRTPGSIYRLPPNLNKDAELIKHKKKCEKMS